MNNAVLTDIHDRVHSNIADEMNDALIEVQDQTLRALVGIDYPRPPALLQPYIEHAAAAVLNSTVQWYHLLIGAKIRAGHYQAIPTRDGKDLYLLRCWITTPRQSADYAERFESGESTLLHWFARGDDDAALHDHPWDFTTEIAAGHYVEHLPPPKWAIVRDEHNRILGPAWDAHTVNRVQGDRIHHHAHDLHCVGQTQLGTVTIVHTGTRQREWGFHPPGRAWIAYRDYFAERRPAGAA